MVKDKLGEIVDYLEPFLFSCGFKRKGKSFDFIKKYKVDYKREELLSFTARQHRNDAEAIYIGCTVGIYYPVLRKIYKSIIEDHLSKYPIIAGSISHFSSKNELMSVCYKRNVNKEDIILYIKNELIDGAFTLFEKHPTLESIEEGIEHKDAIFRNKFYGNVSKEYKILEMCIHYLLQGKQYVLDHIDVFNNEEVISQKFKELE